MIDAGLEAGGDVEPVVVVPVVTAYKLDDLLPGIRRSNLHKVFDWGPRVGKEFW